MYFLRFFDLQMQIAINQRVQLEHDLQMAITGNQFASAPPATAAPDGANRGSGGPGTAGATPAGWWRQGHSSAWPRRVN